MLNVLQTPLAGVQSSFGYTAFRDVLLDSDKVGDHSVVTAHRRDRHSVGIEGPVLAPIMQFALPHLAGKNRIPEFAVKSRILTTRLQQPRALANSFCGAVAGHFGESRVDELNRPGNVGDNNGFRNLADRSHKQCQIGRRIAVPRQRRVPGRSHRLADSAHRLTSPISELLKPTDRR